MSLKKIWIYTGVAPILAMGLAAPLLAGGCGGTDSLTCDTKLVAKVEALSAAAEALVTASGELKGEIALACATIATDMGQAGVPAVNGANTSDDDLTTACDLASASITTAINAGATFELMITGGECTVNASAQLDCEASCQVDASCDPGSIDVRCTPGNLSGGCTGQCDGSCEVQGGSVDCVGSCSAECTGTCGGNCTGTCNGTQSGGTCSGTCVGKCDAECSGTCTGSCTYTAPSATCSGSCTGSCDVAFTAPKCEGELTPPSCTVDADCQAGCKGDAQFSAVCTPPSVELVFAGTANANLQATLEANLPAILNGFQLKGELVFNAAGDVAEKFGAAVDAALSTAACAVTLAGNVAASAAASATASVSVSVSFNASASVGGSAGAA
jgi:hypothetical protein